MSSAATERRTLYDRLREASDEFEDAYAERPSHCGSEQMQRDELAGDALEALLAVVAAAAIYRVRQREVKQGRYTRADVERARDDLDEALEKFDA